jgi:hypothetical protein
MPRSPSNGSSEPVWGRLLPLALLLAPEFWSAEVPEALGSDEDDVDAPDWLPIAEPDAAPLWSDEDVEAWSRGVVALFGVVELLGVVSVVEGVVLMVPAPAPVVVLLPTPLGLVWLETPGELVVLPASGVVVEVPWVADGVPGVVLGVPCVMPVELLPVAPVVEDVPLLWSVEPLTLPVVPAGVELVVPAVLPGIELLLPVPDAPVVVWVAVTPWFSPTGALFVELTLPVSVLPVTVPALLPEPLFDPVDAVPVEPVELVELAPLAAPEPDPVPDCADATPKQSNRAAVIPNVLRMSFNPPTLSYEITKCRALTVHLMEWPRGKMPCIRELRDCSPSPVTQNTTTMEPEERD